MSLEFVWLQLPILRGLLQIVTTRMDFATYAAIESLLKVFNV
jgi:hypothetical protein